MNIGDYFAMGKTSCCKKKFRAVECFVMLVEGSFSLVFRIESFHINAATRIGSSNLLFLFPPPTPKGRKEKSIVSISMHKLILRNKICRNGLKK